MDVKVIFHINEMDKWQGLLHNAANLLAAYEGDEKTLIVEVLANGGEHGAHEAEEQAARDDQGNIGEARGLEHGGEQAGHEEAVVAGEEDVLKLGEAGDQDVDHVAENQDRRGNAVFSELDSLLDGCGCKIINLVFQIGCYRNGTVAVGVRFYNAKEFHALR